MYDLVFRYVLLGPGFIFVRLPMYKVKVSIGVNMGETRVVDSPGCPLSLVTSYLLLLTDRKSLFALGRRRNTRQGIQPMQRGILS